MIKEAILKLAQRNDLTAEEALEVMNEIMDGTASPVQMSSYLTALPEGEHRRDYRFSQRNAGSLYPSPS